MNRATKRAGDREIKRATNKIMESKMKIIMNKVKLYCNSLLVLSLLVGFAQQSAAGQGAINLKLNSYKEIVVENEDGSKTTKLETIDTAIPGDTIVYVTEYTNISSKKVDAGAAIKSLIPKNTVFIQDSIACDSCSAKFSVDVHENAAKANFNTPEQLVVTELDGSIRPATAKDFTLIQWRINKAIEPAASGSITYKVKIKRNTLNN